MFKLRKIILKPQKSFRQLTVPVPVYLSVCFFLRDSSYIILLWRISGCVLTVGSAWIWFRIQTLCWVLNCIQSETMIRVTD